VRRHDEDVGRHSAGHVCNPFMNRSAAVRRLQARTMA
jgi:hypothetical protein